jgi:macrolide transport system ATP-binding/permease protein
MRKLRVWFMRCVGLLRRNRHDQDFAEEIETHLQMQIEANLRSGMNPEQARRQAIVKLGTKETTCNPFAMERLSLS